MKERANILPGHALRDRHLLDSQQKAYQ